MATMISYDVTEHYTDQMPEPFGTYLHSATASPLEIGSVITLRWLDGREAYRVCVERIQGMRLHVRKAKP